MGKILGGRDRKFLAGNEFYARRCNFLVEGVVHLEWGRLSPASDAFRSSAVSSTVGDCGVSRVFTSCGRGRPWRTWLPFIGVFTRCALATIMIYHNNGRVEPRGNLDLRRPHALSTLLLGATAPTHSSAPDLIRRLIHSRTSHPWTLPVSPGQGEPHREHHGHGGRTVPADLHRTTRHAGIVQSLLPRYISSLLSPPPWRLRWRSR